MLAAVPAIVTILLVVGGGYLLGSIPVANLAARRRGVSDLRAVGDRNPGYWNAKEQLGARAALPVFVGDIAKGALAAGFGTVLAGDGEWWLSYVGGGAAMVGHAWPLFAKFDGGRSVLTFVGAATVFAPIPALLAIVAGAIVTVIGRRDLARGARTGVASLPFLQLAIEGRYRTAATGALMTFIGFRFIRATRSARNGDRATRGCA